MKTNYQAPQIEVIEIEGVLCASGDDTFGATTLGGTTGNRSF